jgi:hypothetical protein
MSSLAMLVMSTQAAALVAVAWLLPHRAVLVAVLVAAIVAGLALGHPADFAQSPGALMLELGGAFGGFVAGWWIVGRRRAGDASTQARRRAISRAARKAAGQGADGDGATRVGAGRTAAGFGLGLVLSLGLAAAAWLWTGGEVPSEWRANVAGWGVPVPGAAGPAAASARASAGQREAASLPSGKGGSAPAAGAAGAAAATKADGPRARAHVVTERPSGDLRHCLEKGAGADVARCAEGR